MNARVGFSLGSRPQQSSFIRNLVDWVTQHRLIQHIGRGARRSRVLARCERDRAA